MKANEILSEGIVSDLRAAGRQNQAELGRNIKAGAKNLAMKLPGAKTVANMHGKLANYAANAKTAADVGRAADQWIQLWTTELLNQNEVRRQSGLQPMKQADYNKALESWLERSLKVNADPVKMSQYVRDMNPSNLKNYFQQYFIPQYIKSQRGGAQPAAQAQTAPAKSAAPTAIAQAFTQLDQIAQSPDFKLTPKQRGEIQSLWKSMGGTQIAESRERKIRLYEGLTLGQITTVKLWESAGHKLVEANLTAQQISNIFAAVQQGATAAGGNRTMLGRGKDAASAVSDAWENLKSKVSSSKPIQNMDAAYDSAAAKLKQATGGDQGVMRYVEKYRDFAKKHPVAQSFLYAALIAAAGLSGAGLGGAAALGLFKMTDKLLQGEKFSSAAYSGAKTGAAAGVASSLLGPTDAPTSADSDYMPPGSAYNALERGTEYSGNLAGVSTDDILANPAYQQAYQAAIDRGMNSQTAFKLGRAAAQKAMLGGSLNENQIRLIFRRVERRELAEGLMDTVKQAAGKAGQWVRTKGENLTTNVTADKLQQAWKAAGSPMDSESVAQIIRDAGVSNDVIDNVFQSLNIDAPEAPTADALAQLSKIDDVIATIKSYVTDGGSVTPKMRSIVKDLWMRSGGTKIAEGQR